MQSNRNENTKSSGKRGGEFEIRDIREAGWHWAQNEVVDVFARRIGPVAYCIYMYLARHADNGTQRCTRTQSEIAATFKMSRERVRRHLPRLSAVGLIAIQEGLLGETTTYTLLKIKRVRASKRGTVQQGEARRASRRGLKTRHALKEEKTLFEDYSQDSSSPTADDLGKLATGLREMVSRIDDQAVSLILARCRENCSDCTVEEILDFAAGVSLDRARNPVGLLITAVPLACTRASVENLRSESDQAERARRTSDRENEAAQEHWRQRCAERLRKEGEAKQLLATMDKTERRQRLDSITAKVARQYPGARTWPNISQMVEQLLLHELMGEHTDFPSESA